MSSAADAGLAPQEQEALVAFLLSPAAATERKEAGNSRELDVGGPLSEEEVRQLLEAHVPNVTFMLDRTGCTPVADYIWMTYQHGLPIYRADRSVQDHTVQALRYIFKAAATGTPKGGPDALRRLAEAYQSCQAEQGRTIDALYGKITGRDASIQDQVLALVDTFKALTLEGVVHELNPTAAGQDDNCPSRQAPHITSAYLEAIGAEMGLRGVAAARRDENRPRRIRREQVLEVFKRQFNVAELAGALVADVNQQAADAERVIDRDLFAKWASEAGASGFRAHSIYFDEEHADDYDGRPTEGAQYQPFLSRKVAMQVLVQMFLRSPAGGSEDSAAPSTEKQALLDFLLSPAASTERREAARREAAGTTTAVAPLTEEQVRGTLQKHVPTISFMLDRTGCTPVADYIWMSYRTGLPIYAGNQKVQQHTVEALRYIFNAAITGSPPGGAAALQRLAEAYQSCQAEQGRTIDALYGKLTGRDASLDDQVLALVDSFKALTMESVVYELNPSAQGMGDYNPSGQVPHITSAYLEAVGETLGMRGVLAASNDANKPPVPDRLRVLAAFREHFSLEDLAGALAADVNQQAPDAERLIDRDLLAKWASAAAQAGGFDAHCIYFDEDRAGDFDGRPEAAGQYQPFLSRKVAVEVLVKLFTGKAPEAVKPAAAAEAPVAAPAAEGAGAAREEQQGRQSGRRQVAQRPVKDSNHRRPVLPRRDAPALAAAGCRICSWRPVRVAAADAAAQDAAAAGGAAGLRGRRPGQELGQGRGGAGNAAAARGGKGKGRYGDYALRGKIVRTKRWVPKGTPDTS